MDEQLQSLSHRESQLAMLAVLKTFDSFCHEHGLCYWLGFGSLLGSVRHKGFIPWDDDIDLCMPRVDYDRFLKLAKTIPPEDLHLFHYSLGNNARAFYFSKLGRIDTVCRTPFGDLPWGVSVDVFPMDLVTPSKVEYLNVFRKFMSVGLYGKTGLLRDMLKTMVYWATQILGRDRLYKAIRNWASAEAKDSVWVVGIELGDRNIFSHFQIKKDEVLPLQLGSFEGMEFPCPRDADLYLKRLYNEYWIIPSVQDRETHEVTYVVKG